MGVWIETILPALSMNQPLVTPFVGVWIETVWMQDKIRPDGVTPFVGVWIETLMSALVRYFSRVTPFVGVWIETSSTLYHTSLVSSHPSWVCGLKQALLPKLLVWSISHTLRGCVD